MVAGLHFKILNGIFIKIIYKVDNYKQAIKKICDIPKIPELLNIKIFRQVEIKARILHLIFVLLMKMKLNIL